MKKLLSAAALLAALALHPGHVRADEDDDLNALPAAVQKTAHEQVGANKIEEVEDTYEDGQHATEVEFRENGKKYAVVIAKDGTLIQERQDPEEIFVGQLRETPWDDLQVAYFQGEALWTYLNTPFLYTRPGFVTEEIAPIQVDGEQWRRLKITFPESIKSHTREQISCFGPDGLLRRHDYTVDILGGATGLNYASDYRDVTGIIFATKRRIYAYEGDYQLVPEPLLVKIDMGEITVR